MYAFSSLGVCLKSEPKKLDGGDPSPEGEELERVEEWWGTPLWSSTVHTAHQRGSIGFRGQMDALNEYVWMWTLQRFWMLSSVQCHKKSNFLLMMASLNWRYGCYDVNSCLWCLNSTLLQIFQWLQSWFQAKYFARKIISSWNCRLW